MGPEGPVLVVEDDDSIRELLRDALAQEGLEVAVAGDGDEAIRLATDRRPALVILDLGLPKVGGREVYDAILRLHGDRIPFIVVTASRRLEDAAATIRAVRYLGKPFDLNDLVGAVRAALEPPPGTVGQEVPAPAI